MRKLIYKSIQAWSGRRVRWLQTAVLLLFIGLVGWLSQVQAAEVRDVRRINLGTGSLQADKSSFFVFTSADGRYVTFQSWASNWHPNDPKPNWVDIFVRDQVADTTVQVTFGDDDSFDPIMTADGRYVVFNSYAKNLVPNDNNSHPWYRDGLDLFLYDRVGGGLQRVSLNDKGEEILGNSLGTITPDGNYVIFVSNGQNVIEANGEQKTAVFLRDWRSGYIERITVGIDAPNAYPNATSSEPRASYDGRYIVYNSEASNLVPNDTNGVGDVFLYDRNSGETKRISVTPTGGNSNGRSAQAKISPDGRYIVFKSFANNLVPGDTNGEADIFRYTVATGEIELVSLSTGGAQGNAEAKDPSVCDGGRFVSFTSAATNLVPGDTNGERDIFLRDMERGETSVVTINNSGVWGNGRAHRSYITNDCRIVNYATEADNVVPGDTNNARDMFAVDIVWPPDFSGSGVAITGVVASGEQLTYTYTLRNEGTDATAATFSAQIPGNTTYVPASVSGATYSGGTVSWNGNLPGGGSRTISFSTTINAGLTEFTLIDNDATLTGDGETYDLGRTLAINGENVFLPLIGVTE